MDIEEIQFIVGFNNAYILAQYEPKMLALLLKDIRPINSYLSGMSSGQREYELGYTNKSLNDLGKIRQKYRDEKNITKD
ncbi:MAG: hypothetical protein IPK91_06300 [Saprospiraceae bacterium]|nr:hypothetical protein [Saprospiraceae bacterium]